MCIITSCAAPVTYGDAQALPHAPCAAAASAEPTDAVHRRGHACVRLRDASSCGQL